MSHIIAKMILALAAALAAGWAVAQSSTQQNITTFKNATTSALYINGHDGKPSIIIRPDGTVEITNASLDEASAMFWDAVQRMGVKLACPSPEK